MYISYELINLIIFVGGAFIGGTAVYAVLKPKDRHKLLLRIILYLAIAFAAIASGAATVSQVVPLLITPTPTPTPLPPTVALTGTQTPPILIINHGGGIVRTAPNAVANTIYLTGNQQLFITGICPDGTYYRVNYDNQEGWVHTYWVQEVEGDLSSVPVVEDADC